MYRFREYIHRKVVLMIRLYVSTSTRPNRNEHISLIEDNDSTLSLLLCTLNKQNSHSNDISTDKLIL